MTVRLVFSIIFLLVFLVTFGLSFVKWKVSSYSSTREGEPEKILRVVSLLCLGIGLFLGALSTVRVVDPGKVGIPVTFGNAGAPFGSGVHLVNPFSSVQILSVRTENYTMSVTAGEGNKQGDDSVSVLGADGAQAGVDATLLYKLNTSSASDVYDTLGTDYVEKLIRPTARTCIRGGFSTTAMVEAATTKRSDVARSITDCITADLEPRGFTLEEFQLRDIHLSAEVQAAIDSKVKAQQTAQQQQFELSTTQQKAEIARVEAQGRSDAQQIISCGGNVITADDGSTKVVPNTDANCKNTLSAAYLQYLYIQSLEAIAASPNNSTVILPFDQDLTPLLNLTPTSPKQE